MTYEQQNPAITPRPGIPWVRMIVSSILGISKTGILVIALIATLALNVTTLTFLPAFNLLSSAIGAMTSKPVTIRSKHKGEIASMKQSYDKKTRALKAQRKLVSAHKNQAVAADKYIASLNKKINGLEHVNFKGRTLGKAVQETTERISRRVATATARSVGSIAAESIPYIGIGAIVGVTALELDDACKTMKDLHALDVAFNPSAANDADATEVCGQRVPTKEEVIAELKQSPAKAWEAAKSFDLPDLPSWDESILAAKRKWQEILSWMKDLLGS